MEKDARPTYKEFVNLHKNIGVQNLITMQDLIESLIIALNDEKDDMRRVAAEALGDIGDTKAVEALITTLKDKDLYVRNRVIAALGKIGDNRATEPLIAVLKNEKEDSTRWRITQALKKIKDPRATEALILVLEDNNSPVCEEAAEALGEIGNVKAIKPLITAINNTINPNVYRKAKEALMKIGYHFDHIAFKTCDICQKVYTITDENEWIIDDKFNTGKTTIKFEIDIKGYKKFIKIDICPKCFEKKLLPELKHLRIDISDKTQITINEKEGTIKVFEDSIYPHKIGDEYCNKCWNDENDRYPANRYPAKCFCGGLIHSEIQDEDTDSSIIAYKCDKCGRGESLKKS